MATLAEIFVHPVKSCAPLRVSESLVQARGLEHDRRWMVVDTKGGFLTARELPALLLVTAQPRADGLGLQAPGMPTLALGSGRPGERLPVTVWKSELSALAAGPDADAWFSEYLGQSVRLVHMDPGSVRPVTSSRAQAGDEVSFADAMPLLLVSRASLDALNARLANPVDISRFRPNLVVEGVAAHDEDDRTAVRVGPVLFDVAKPCTRCLLVNIDPATGRRDDGGEPLRTLAGYRRFEDGVAFGQLLVPRSGGIVRRGDEVVFQ